MRDLLLERPVRDVDLVVAGDAIGFAGSLAKELGAEVRPHDRFATATLTLPGGERLDVARARKETYARPGALPEVSPAGSIEEDLARRDFPVNAMALELSPGRRLVDPYGGREDLARERIRFLHPASPVDDPTRAFRAVRYANRLGFRVAPEARRAIAAALEAHAVDRVSGDRLRREIRFILSEPGRGRAVRALGLLGLAAAVAPELAGPGSGTRVASAERIGREAGDVGWLCYFFAWMGPIGARALAAIADRLAVAGRERRALYGWHDLRAILAAGAKRRRPVEIARVLRGRSRDEVVAVASELRAEERRTLLHAIAVSRDVRLSIRGSDLIAEGIPPGPEVGHALAATLAARAEGRISTAQELAFALDLARERRGGPR